MVRQPPLFVVVGARHARDSSVGAGTVAGMARSHAMVRQPRLFVVVGARHARDSGIGAGTVAGMARS